MKGIVVKMDDIMRKINSLNPNINIMSVHDRSFKRFGMVYKDFKIDNLLDYIEKKNIVSDEVVYIADVPYIRKKLSSYINPITVSIYGGLEVQVGVCYGRNNILNGLEFHQGSEVYIVGADMIMMLGIDEDIRWPGGMYDSSLIQFFYAPKGSVIELKGGCMHYAGVNVYHKEGINVIVSLLKGTNSIIDFKMGDSYRDKLLIAKNSWFIAHPGYTKAKNEGWHLGITGENFELKTL
jgi:hypothetical protein